MPPSNGGRYGSSFFDQAADDVLFNIVFSCDDPGDMFAIIVSIKQVATGVCSITLSLCLSEC